MDLTLNAKLFALALVIFIILDFLWIGIIMKNFYLEEMKEIARLKDGNWNINFPAAFVVYLLLALGLILFILPLSSTPIDALLYGLAFGLISYGIYDFTNLATIAIWNLKLALIDMAWGGVVCAIASFSVKYLSRII